MSGAKYLPPDEFEKAVSEFFGGDNGKTHIVMTLASRACEGTDGMYIPKSPYVQRKRIHPTPFDIFRESLARHEEEGIVLFLCNRFPTSRVKVAKAVAGKKERLGLTPGDDARVTSKMEKRLRRAVGQEAFALAKEELLRLVPTLPPDDSGQMVMFAMDLIVANHQINQLDETISKSYEPQNGKPGGGPSERITKQKKELSTHRERMLKILGLTSEDLIKRAGGNKTGTLVSAAEALADMVEGTIATADFMSESSRINAAEGKKDAVSDIDQIDRAFLDAPVEASQ